MLESVCIVAQVGVRRGHELGLCHATRDELGIVVQPFSQFGEVSCDVVEDAEVDQRETLGSAAADLVERGVPRLHVDVGRRRRRDDPDGWIDAHARCVTGEQEPVPQVADVMCRVTGAREAVEIEDPFADDVDVLLGDRHERSPEGVERVAVEASGTALEAGRVDEMGRADGRHVHGQPRVLAHKDTGRARVVEVDV